MRVALAIIYQKFVEVIDRCECVLSEYIKMLVLQLTLTHTHTHTHSRSDDRAVEKSHVMEKFFIRVCAFVRVRARLHSSVPYMHASEFETMKFRF